MKYLCIHLPIFILTWASYNLSLLSALQLNSAITGLFWVHVSIYRSPHIKEVHSEISITVIMVTVYIYAAMNWVDGSRHIYHYTGQDDHKFFTSFYIYGLVHVPHSVFKNIPLNQFLGCFIVHQYITDTSAIPYPGYIQYSPTLNFM